MIVEWADARALTDEGKLVGFVHVDCENPEAV